MTGRCQKATEIAKDMFRQIGICAAHDMTDTILDGNATENGVRVCQLSVCVTAPDGRVLSDRRHTFVVGDQ